MSSLIDVFRPTQKKTVAFLFDCLAVLAGSLFIATLAQMEVRLAFTPVPMTLQPLAILLIGGLLGSRRGALAAMAYLAEGAMGFPVFAGGVGGVIHLIGPTGGYLFSYIAVTFLVGSLLERRWKRGYATTLIAMALGDALILTVGSLWLSFYVGSVQHAFAVGAYPFIMGDALQVIAVTALIPSGWKILNLLR